MSSRLFIACLPLAVFSVALGASTSCGGPSIVHPLLDGGAGGLGGLGTTTNASSSSSKVASSSSSAASSSSGHGGSCPGIDKCATAADCPAFSTKCLVSSCAGGCCATSPAAAHAPCTDSGGTVCDGKGKCIGCVTAADCGTGMACTAASQCISAHCTNGMKDANETDVDCGGPDCMACADNKMCATGTDCVDKVCVGSVCQMPSCSDNVKNGMETDVDCGGPVCPMCVDNQACLKSSDCKSLDCVNGKCAPATCKDGIQNQDETDVDCGGTFCNPCADGKNCKVAKDCADKVCSGMPPTCATPTCTDLVQNGKETDVDCGGGTCPPCQIGQKCGAPADCVGNLCQGTCQCPAGMIEVPIQGGGDYCIDTTEVTYQSYQTFYSANPAPANQPPYCAWNAGWTPAGDWPFQQNQTTEPVRYVNWCQAAAYCKYNGKRLCGAIGGGSASQASFADFTKDQWFNACSSQGQNCDATGCYPYGKGYKPFLCNGFDAVDGGSPGPTSYTSYSSCVGGPPGLLEMSGNVAEWEDSCSAMTGESDTCAARGGSYRDGQTSLRCDSGGAPVTHARNYQDRDVGFRCCL
jgi:formylglycine-generating enzyme required for sulfatase activity